jgi:histone H3/H4
MTGGVKKHYHFHPRTTALHKIHHHQKPTELLIRKLPFQSLAKSLVLEIARLISVSKG